MIKPRHKMHKFKNLTLTVLSIVLVILLSKNPEFNKLIASVGSLGPLGAFIGGALFVCTFMISLGAIILFGLAKTTSPLEIGVFAAAGAVFTDFVVFRYVKNNLMDEIEELYQDISGHHLKVVVHSKFFGWFLPVLGALILASPLPDEIGVSLMGIAKMNPITFLLLSFVLNGIGIIIAVSLPNFKFS
jgi:hypothetical protein